MAAPRIADLDAGIWNEHSRFAGIYAKSLLGTADNPFATINVIRVPPGGSVGRHRHASQVETIYILTGEAVLTVNQDTLPLKRGQLVAIPIGIEHALQNDGDVTAEVLTIFTPPLT